MPNANASKNSSATEGVSVGLIPEQCDQLGKKDFHVCVHLAVSHTCAWCAKVRTHGSRAGRGGSAGITPEKGQQMCSPGLPGGFG